jgi:hypothetical protein
MPSDSAFVLFSSGKTALMLSRSIRNFLEPRRKNARNPRRFARVTNLSFSCSSLLALTVCLVRIRQATAKPRLTSLPTQYCGVIDWLVAASTRFVTASTQAPWQRMGTEGTRGQARRLQKRSNALTFRLSLCQSGGRLPDSITQPVRSSSIPPPDAQAQLISRHTAVRPCDESTSCVVSIPASTLPSRSRLPCFELESLLVSDNLVGLRKTYGWQFNRRSRKILPFQHLRQPSEDSVLELFAVVGRSAVVAPRLEHAPMFHIFMPKTLSSNCC